MIIEIMATQKFVTHLQPKRAESRINTGFQLFLGHSNSAQGNLFPLSVALFQALEMAVFLPFITIILFFQNFRYHSGIIGKHQAPVNIQFKITFHSCYC
jgi:hypothetical protein